MDYMHTLPPLEHQRQAFAKAAGKRAFAYLMDQGTGKTKSCYDDAFNLALLGAIGALVVIAPNDVHRAWIEEELPKHALKEVPVTAVVWDGKRTKKKAAELETLFNTDTFKVFAINVEAFQKGKPHQNRAFQFAKRVLLAHKAMLVVDESQDIKTPKSQRTRTVIALSKFATHRRIGTGTVITEAPFEFYSQFRFLDPEILGFTTYTAFKAHHGIFIKKKSPHKKINPRTGREEDIWYDELVQYKNIEELLERVKPYCFRVDKRDACPDLPKKIVMPVRRVALSPAQKRIYKTLLDEGIAEVRSEAFEKQVKPRAAQSLEDELWRWCSDDDVPKIVADNALKVQGKLRQVCGGVVRDSNGQWHRVEDKPPKLRALLADIEHNGEPAIIWCIYREECELVADALREQYGKDSTVVYSGLYDDEQRAAAKRAFQDVDSPVKFFVTSYMAARGHTLTKATTAYYYSVHDSAEKRIQSEDRNHRVGAVGVQHNGQHVVLYTEYCVAGTCDEKRRDETEKKVAQARQTMEKLEEPVTAQARVL